MYARPEYDQLRLGHCANCVVNIQGLHPLWQITWKVNTEQGFLKYKWYHGKLLVVFLI